MSNGDSRRTVVPTGFATVSLSLAAAVLVSLACGDDGPTAPPPGPGELVATIVSPNGAEGAAVLETSDAGIVTITAAAGQTLHWQAGAVTRIVVIRDAAGEIRFTLDVEERSDPPQLEIVEVADGNNELRGDLSRYRVALSW